MCTKKGHFFEIIEKTVLQAELGRIARLLRVAKKRQLRKPFNKRTPSNLEKTELLKHNTQKITATQRIQQKRKHWTTILINIDCLPDKFDEFKTDYQLETKTQVAQHLF